MAVKTPRILVLIVLFLSAFVSAARALDLRDVLIDYTLTSWGRKDGLTGPIWAIAQDRDGFLWLGTDDGLARFDGVRFVAWDAVGGSTLPSASVRTLHLSSDDSLWVGFAGNEGVARIHGKQVQMFSTINNTATGTVSAIAEDREHRIWVAAASGLFRFAKGEWQQLGPAQSLPESGFTTGFVDMNGAMWIGAAEGFFSNRGSKDDQFTLVEPLAPSVRALSISQDGTGRMWANDPIAGYRPMGDRFVAPRGGQAGRGFRLLHDRDGNLWVATIGQGLWRVRNAVDPARINIEKSTVLSGLSSDAVRCVFEDRDGNIWAGTTEGVDRLVPHRITPWTGLGLVATIEAADATHVWVGTEDDLIRFSRHEHGVWEPDALRLPLRGVRMIRSNGRGLAWVSSTEGVFRIEGTSMTRISLPPGLPPLAIEVIASDRRVGMWAIANGGVLLHDDGNQLRVIDQIPALRNARAQAATTTTDGRLWIGYSGSRVGAYAGPGRFTSFSSKDGLIDGTYYGLHEDLRGALWVAGTNGLSRFNGERFVSVTQANGIPAAGVYALTEDQDGFLWLATGAGVHRLERAEFDAVAGNPTRQLHFRSYDSAEGLAGLPVQLGDRNAVRAGDGSIWFITSRGVSVVDPRGLAAARPQPRLVIDEVMANDVPVTSDRLAAGTSKLQIEYTAPELTYPLKPRFRYRLDGFDTDWVDAGRRRTVLYTNLPPRRYTFHVAVSDDEGRWSSSEVTYAFTLAPRFYQTWWFYVGIALAAAAVLGGAYQLRLRQLRKQFSLVLGERVRLSRELHDTLLQSLVGLALEFDAVSKTIDASPTAARDRIVKIRERVEEYIREARRSIWSLRSPALETAELTDALRASGERATQSQGVEFSFNVHGNARRQPANVEHQILRIGQEAVLNAVRHSGAHHIHMELSYGDDQVTLRVIDDGCGFEPGRGGAGTTNDHYGITTMHERAQQIGGQVSISSAPGAGTTIEAVVPSHETPAEAA